MTPLALSSVVDWLKVLPAGDTVSTLCWDVQPSGVSIAPLYTKLCCCGSTVCPVFRNGKYASENNGYNLHRYIFCVFLPVAVFFYLPQDLKNKEKAERDARTQVAEAQHTNIKDEIAKQVGLVLGGTPD